MNKKMVLLLVLLIPSLCWADDTFLVKASAWQPFFAEPCQRYGVPVALALAIAHQESGIHPYAVNVEGKGYPVMTREGALAIVSNAMRSGQSVDVGLMQVNSFWLNKYNIKPEVALDPRNNIKLGVWILANEIRRHGLNWRAVGAYHTPLERNPLRAQNYAVSVIRQMKILAQASKQNGGH